MKVYKIMGIAAATFNLCYVVYVSALVINCIAEQKAPIWLLGIMFIAIIVTVICFAYMITPKQPENSD